MTQESFVSSNKKYQLGEQIASTAFSAVYEGLHLAYHVPVAIKHVAAIYANRDDLVTSFDKEINLSSQLIHPFIVPIWDYWRDSDGAFIVMPLFKGNLRHIIAENPQGMNLATIAMIIERMVSALTAAHAVQIVHCDIKPENILIDVDNQAFLSDFGLANFQSNLETDVTSIKGSPYYLSPEQIMQGEITPLVDIYALGLLLYEMLTGQKPVDGDNVVHIFKQHLSSGLPSVIHAKAGLNAEFDIVIAKATAKNPVDRYQSPQAFLKAFQQVLKLHKQRLTVIDNHKTEPRPLTRNPYKGLYPFNQTDKDEFFGREEQITRIFNRFNETDNHLSHFLMLIGPTGSGKTSLVQAGILPTLRERTLGNVKEWVVATVRPHVSPVRELEQSILRSFGYEGTHPGESLATIDGLSLLTRNHLKPHQGLFLFIDDFERIFRSDIEVAERKHFIALLESAAKGNDDHLWILAAMDAYYVGDPLQIYGFSELIQQRSEMIIPLTLKAAEKAIVEPANKVHLKIDQGFISAILADARSEVQMLPLIQFALMNAFDEAMGRPMTLPVYLKIGGLRDAVQQSAESIYQSLDEDQQLLTRQLFIMLSQAHKGERPQVRWSDMLLIAPSNRVASDVKAAFVSKRLIRVEVDILTDDPFIYLAHPIILQKWSRIEHWVNPRREEKRDLIQPSWNQPLMWRLAALAVVMIALLGVLNLWGNGSDGQQAPAGIVASVSTQIVDQEATAEFVITPQVRSANVQTSNVNTRLQSQIIASKAKQVLDQDRSLALALAVEAVRLDRGVTFSVDVLMEILDVSVPLNQPQPDVDTLISDAITSPDYRLLTCEERRTYSVEPYCAS